MVQEIKEHDLYPIITSADRFRDSLFFSQVPTADWTEGRKRIDLVTAENGNVVTIELKVCDWRRALHQAFRNLFVSDLSYVAMWHRHFEPINRNMFLRSGIGLIELNGTASVVIEAENSRFTIPQKKEYVMAQCTSERVYHKS